MVENIKQSKGMPSLLDAHFLDEQTKAKKKEKKIPEKPYLLDPYDIYSKVQSDTISNYAKRKITKSKSRAKSTLPEEEREDIDWKFLVGAQYNNPVQVVHQLAKTPRDVKNGVNMERRKMIMEQLKMKEERILKRMVKDSEVVDEMCHGRVRKESKRTGRLSAMENRQYSKERRRAKSPTKRSKSPKKKEKKSKSPSSLKQYRLLPKICPKKTLLRTPERFIDGTYTNSSKSFYSTIQELAASIDSKKAFKKLYDYNLDLIPAIEAMQAKKKMVFSQNYKSFKPTGKSLTPYRHQVSLRLLLDALEQNRNG